MALRILLSVGVALLALGCSEDGGAAANGGQSGTGGAGGSAGARPDGSAGGGATGDGGVPCSEDPSEIPAGAVCIHEVHGRIVDETRTPIPSLLATVCGAICFFGESDPSGRFTVPVGAHIPLADYSVLPHARPQRVGFFFQLPIDAAGPVIDMGDLPVPALPVDGPVLVVKTDNAGAPAQTVTSGDVTLDVEAGVSLELDVDEVAEKEIGKKFRTLSVPETLRSAFVDPALGVVALYALAPFDASFRRVSDDSESMARLSFKNTAALSPGAAVEVLALGSYLDFAWVRPATFEPVATARVSADGARIELDAGQGLKRLTWVGLREKR